MVFSWDDAVFEAFRRGELELFYKKCYPGLILYAIHLLGQEKGYLAEDCVQDAVYKSWERRASFDSIHSLKAFLYTSIKNDIISIHRKDSARQHYIKQLDEAIFFRNTLIDQEAQVLLYNAINELPEKMKEVFQLSFMEGLKTTEIAERLQLSDSSVRKYKLKSLEMLRAKLSPALFSFFFSGVL